MPIVLDEANVKGHVAIRKRDVQLSRTKRQR